jgi:LuxR family maltose regulon positive regulatory protein
VSTDRAGGWPDAARLDAVLLEAKLSVPRYRPGSVSRAGLIDKARSGTTRVVGITAPAGYGKSTLLAQWAEVEDRRVGWVSLDRMDDEPLALLAVLASAYSRISGRPAEFADAAGFGASALGRAAPRLAAALRTSPVPFVLILDDLHELRSPACHDVLGVVISGIPEGSQLVAASRFEQPHLPPLRASGDAVELGAGDLALDARGAEQIFTQAHVDITPEAADAVTARTEGWPVGLYLAASIASETHGDVSTITGDDRFVADYLYRESLAQLPEAVQRFLRSTAIVDQMCAPLCEALLEEPGAQAHLVALEATSTFLVPLDRRREWYRYHALFREFLLGELRRVNSDVMEKLHLLAADWYESNGSPSMALEHLVNTGERDRCVKLAAQLLLPTFQAGQSSTGLRWLQVLGSAAIESYPPLAALTAWLAALTGNSADAHRWAAFVDTARFDLRPMDGTASFASSSAMLAALMCRSGPQQMADAAGFATRQEPSWSPWRAVALALSAESQLLLGDVDQATRLFTQTSVVATQLGNIHSVILSNAELAVLAMDHGRWAQAAEHAELALSTVHAHRLNDYSLSVLAYAAAARLAVHEGNRKEADAQIARAMRARPTCTYAIPWLAVRVRLQLAKVHAAIADPASARHLLLEIDDILDHRPDLGTSVQEVSALRDTLASSARVKASGGTPLTQAELRLLPYLQTHLTFGEIAERLFVSRNTVASEVSAIYRKLGVSSRSDAVECATTIGLLGA